MGGKVAEELPHIRNLDRKCLNDSYVSNATNLGAQRDLETMLDHEVARRARSFLVDTESDK